MPNRRVGQIRIFIVEDYRALPFCKRTHIVVAGAITYGVTGKTFSTQLSFFDAPRKWYWVGGAIRTEVPNLAADRFSVGFNH